MKLLKDLVLTRREFHVFDDVLEWGSDGTLYFVTQSNLTVAEPVFKKEIHGASKDLFHLDDLPLEVDNKFEFTAAEKNSLLNSQPVSFIRQIRVNQTNPGIFAALTSNFNINLYKDNVQWQQIDQPDAALAQRCYHSLAWSPNGTQIAVGNEAGEIVIFKLENNQVFHVNTVVLDSDSVDIWVTNIKWTEQGIFTVLTNNSIYLTVLDGTRLILPSNRSKVTDLTLLGTHLLVTSIGYAYKINLHDNVITQKDMESFDKFYIIPTNNETEIVLLSNSKSVKLQIDNFMDLQTDDIIRPHLDKKIKRWNESYNPYEKYTTQLTIYDIKFTHDKSCMAIVYKITKLAFRYKITSQAFFNIVFIPLNKFWQLTNKTSGLAWYQIYNIYGKTLPLGYDSVINEPKLDINLSFGEYLIKMMNNIEMTKMKFQNMVCENEPSIKLFYQLIFAYADTHMDIIDNNLDKASIYSLSILLELKPGSSILEIEPFSIQNEYITETFDITNEMNTNMTIVSSNGNKWRRCAITLLPIITTKVKVCPVSGKRIIDVKRDTVNDYGWFTRTLLETFNQRSAFSGSRLTEK